MTAALVAVTAHAGHMLLEAAFFAPPAALVLTAVARTLRAKRRLKRLRGGHTP